MSDGRGVRGIPYAFAGLSEVRKDKATRETKETFTIITTDPNEVMRGLDDRMPVILYRKDYVQWMAPADPRQFPVNLLRPCPAVDMKGCKVGADVGNVRNNRPELCDPVCRPGSQSKSQLSWRKKFFIRCSAECSNGTGISEANTIEEGRWADKQRSRLPLCSRRK